MSPPANIFEPRFEAGGSGPAPFDCRQARLGVHAGARELGISLFELSKSQATCPLHFHHGNEEMLIVLSGRPTLRGKAERRTLEPGEVVSFPRGPAGAHRLDNETEEVVRVLLISTMHGPDIIEYPDSGKVMARSEAPGRRPADPGAFRLVVRREAAVDYYAGEVEPQRP
jgi:uncharacterized cupin superfamily protein